MIGVSVACRFGSTRSEISDNPNVVKKNAQKTRPWVYVARPRSALPLWLIAFNLYEQPTESSYAPPTAPPGLWRTPPDRCKAPGEQARPYAIEQRLFAEGKRERGPFHIQDGVNAVPLFEMASVCFRRNRATASPRPGREPGRAGPQGRSVNEDYRARTRCRALEHALTVGDDGTAEREVRVLRAFTDGQQGPYVTWLSNPRSPAPGAPGDARRMGKHRERRDLGHARIAVFRRLSRSSLWEGRGREKCPI